MLAALTSTSPFSEPRRRSALERFGRFFAELEETFLEREDVLAQLALALLAREHVLITGPPGTGKSRLASGVVGRVVHEQSGEPSLFAKQFTESTVQTELIGPVDFRTLTETGRTAHFTDEGMLGAVHAFLDEVLDGRDMLLRSTLNILEERELKQGTRITPGLIECAVMTSNRYLTEVLEQSRQTLLAFVDRIAFVAFVPRGFADPGSLERIVSATLGDGIDLRCRLTVEDVDVLQEMVEQVHVPAGLVTQLVELARDFEERAGQLERSDPTFTSTRYFSTRAVARLARLLKAVVVRDMARGRDRRLVAELEDLGMLRLAFMLAGPGPDEVERLLEHETDARERRQLHIMKCELELFSDCLRALEAPPDEEAPSAPASEAPSAPAASSEHALAEALAALTVGAADFAAIEGLLAASKALEDERPERSGAARAARGRALEALGDALDFAAPSSLEPSIGPLTAHLELTERAHALREALLAAEVATIDREAEAQRAEAANLRAREHAITVFDRMAHDAVKDALHEGASPSLDAMLDALEPMLRELRRIDARLTALGVVDAAPSEVVLGRRLAPAMAATYASAEAPDRAHVGELVDGTLTRLEALALASTIDIEQHLGWVADALARGTPPLPEEEAPATFAGYRAMRVDEVRTPMAYALAQLVTTLEERSGDGWEPSLEAMATALGSLPEGLRATLGAIDLDRLERTVAQLEAWLAASPGRPDDALLVVAFEENALLRFALECRLVGRLFAEHQPRAEAITARLRAVSDGLRAQVERAQRDATEARWAALIDS